MITRIYRILGLVCLLCMLFSAVGCAFSCDDTNPKLGFLIIEHSSEKHELSAGRDLITQTQKMRLCKGVKEADRQYIPLVTNSNYGKLWLTNCTIKQNGATKKCENRFVEEYTDGTIIYLPTMNPGDVIEYSYQEEIEFMVGDNVWSTTDIYLEGTSPIEKRILKIEVPKTLSFQYYASKQEPMISEEGDKKTYVWEVSNVPYYEEETLMPPMRHSLSRVSFTTFKTWDQIESWFEELFKDTMQEQYVKDQAAKLTKNAKTDREKVDLIYNWVRENISYQEYGLTFLSGYKPRDLDDVLADKRGDCKAKAALLSTMLTAVGIKSYPAVVSYRDIYRDVPGPYSFYHAINYLPDFEGGLWLDATCTYCPSGYLPAVEQGLNSLILLDNSRGFTITFRPPPEKASNTTIRGREVLSEDGSVKGEAHFRMTGDTPYQYKYISDKVGMSSIKAILEETMDTMLTKKCGTATINDMEIDIGDGYMDMSMDYSCRNYATRSGKKLVLNSEGDSMTGLEAYTETISKDTRRFPILISTDTIVDAKTELQLPACYGIEEALRDDSMNRSFIEVDDDTWFDNDTSIIHSKVMIRFKQTEIQAEGFAGFKKTVEDIMEPESIIMYSRKDEAADKAEEIAGLINKSAAEEAEKTAWISRLNETKKLADDGKCAKAIDSLATLEEDVKTYLPKKTEETKPAVDAGGIGEVLSKNILLIAGAAIVIIALVLIGGRKK